MWPLSWHINAQTTRIGKNDNIYLTLNKEGSYIVKNVNYRDNIEKIQDNHTISIKRNNVDIYTYWLNPMQFKIQINNEIVDNKSVKELAKFTTVLSSLGDITALPGIDTLMSRPRTGSIDFKSSTKDLSEYRGVFEKHIKDLYNENEPNKVYEIINKANKSIKEYSTNEYLLLSRIYNLKQTADKTEQDYDIATENASTKVNNLNKAKENQQYLLKQDKKCKKKINAANKQLVNAQNEADIAEMKKVYARTIRDDALQEYNSELEAANKNKEWIKLLNDYIILVEKSLEGKSYGIEKYYHLEHFILPDWKSIDIKLKVTKRDLDLEEYTLKDKEELTSFKLHLEKIRFY